MGNGDWALVSKGTTVITIDADISQESGVVESAKAIAYETEREVALCQWNGHTLTIAPQTSQLQVHMQAGVVLPFSYVIDDGFSPTIRGETSTGNALDVPSISGETRCVLYFKYLPGDVNRSTLDARAKLLIANGVVSEFQWEGKHASLFDVDIEDGRIIRLTLVKEPHR